MDEQFDFRALLVKLQDCLSANDRIRLHFLLGDMIPRIIRDDPTLGGTLHLLESLFDQGRINSQDFGYLIHAFRKIKCYAAVRRLEEHQRAQQQPKEGGPIFNQVINDNDDDDVDKMPHSVEGMKRLFSPNEPKPTNGSSTSFYTESKRKRSDTMTESDNEKVNICKTKTRQSIMSRLTICHIIIFVLNLFCIISFFIIIMIVNKQTRLCKDMKLALVGAVHGNQDGGTDFDDAKDCSLTFNEQLIAITGHGTTNTMNYIIFHYSNNKTSIQHGETPSGNSVNYRFELKPKEHIDSVTIYTGTRLILNWHSPNGTFIVIGLRFYTNQGRQQLFGSDDGQQINEYFPDYRLGYARGRALGHVDAIQFIWYRETESTATAILPKYNA